MNHTPSIWRMVGAFVACLAAEVDGQRIVAVMLSLHPVLQALVAGYRVAYIYQQTFAMAIAMDVCHTCENLASGYLPLVTDHAFQ